MVKITIEAEPEEIAAMFAKKPSGEESAESMLLGSMANLRRYEEEHHATPETLGAIAGAAAVLLSSC